MRKSFESSGATKVEVEDHRPVEREGTPPLTSTSGLEGGPLSVGKTGHENNATNAGLDLHPPQQILHRCVSDK